MWKSYIDDEWGFMAAPLARTQKTEVEVEVEVESVLFHLEVNFGELILKLDHFNPMYQ